MMPQTLFSLAGQVPTRPSLAEATLILVDCQNEYLDGPLALAGVHEAVSRAELLLQAARRSGARIIHVVHKGKDGGPFDRTQHRGVIIEALVPQATEVVVEKTLPNSFARTDLADHVGPAGTDIIVIGFMTHHCVSSTVRAALDHGYCITVAGDACATRDLPSGNGVIRAAHLHAAELAALGDRHAGIAQVADLIRGW